MKKIVISYPDFFTGESDELFSLLRREDIWRVHIRKPCHDMDKVRGLIDEIPKEYRHKISIHEHLYLAVEYGLGGVHLSSRNSTLPHGWQGLVSRSFHKIEEFGQPDYDYAFLSPVFPSISKPGYFPTLSKAEMQAAVNSKIIALGGVTEERLAEVEKMGFGGAAFLGNVWRREIDMDAFGLQFITHPVSRLTIEKETEKVLSGGCRWVQLRHKHADTETIINEGRTIADLCKEMGATFIIDDRVDLVDAVCADGVHLGKYDMPVNEARKLLGPRKIIGATANSFEDIERAYIDGADYVGLGPFKFTTTKSNLSPILGIEGYRRIMDRCRASGIRIPIVAIGGITAGDIKSVMHTGVDGIAISSGIINTHNPTETTRRIRDILSGCNY